MKKFLIAVLFLMPSFAFASTDSDIRSNILQTLLTQFVNQVTAIDAIRNQVALSSNPAQFKNLTDVIAAQLQYTTQSLAGLLNGVTDSIVVPNTPSVNFGSTAPTTGGTITPSMPVVDKSGITVSMSGPTTNGIFTFVVRVLDNAGVTVSGVNVHMNAPDITPDTPIVYRRQDIVINAQDTPRDWVAIFNYLPTNEGTQTITFTSGNFTKTITINVQ